MDRHSSTNTAVYRRVDRKAPRVVVYSTSSLLEVCNCASSCWWWPDRLLNDRVVVTPAGLQLRVDSSRWCIFVKGRVYQIANNKCSLNTTSKKKIDGGFGVVKVITYSSGE